MLRIDVFNQPDLSGTYTVGIGGSLSFPLVGRIDASERTVTALEDSLRERLAKGYLRDPRVTVAVVEYRSRRVFVLGQVRRPGAYPSTGPMTVVELLALAGDARSWRPSRRLWCEPAHCRLARRRRGKATGRR